MKWRTSAIYLLILLLIGGYFYYFEVLQKQAKETADREARRMFTFAADLLTAIEVRQGDSEPVILRKEEKWRIVQPLNADIDRAVFDRFLSALKNIEQERNLGPSAENLQAYGLNSPPLRIRVQAGAWQELVVGAKNPTETGRYAKTNAGDDVFLMPRASFDSLNRGVNDFRKKELFTWRTEQVAGVELVWEKGENVRLQRGESGEWTAPGKPELTIKKRKVETLLEEFQWLRASDFLDAKATLPKPLVSVKLKLKGGESFDLAIASPDPATSQAVATCTGLDAPVRINSTFLSSLPKSDAALADRSLLGWDSSQVRKIVWKSVEGAGTATWINDKTWGTGEANPAKPLKDSIPFRTLLAELNEWEYSELAQPAPEFPEDDLSFVQMLSSDGKRGSISWKDAPQRQGNEPTVLWLNKNGEIKAVSVPPEVLQRFRGLLADLTKAVSQTE
ncbi:MAG: DUF4340 domain-containing protein [Desulfobacteraceae bacterium]|nr:DUF4340 domain-containing protein [Desulfobacteraceae bacterium]